MYLFHLSLQFIIGVTYMYMCSIPDKAVTVFLFSPLPPLIGTVLCL